MENDVNNSPVVTDSGVVQPAPAEQEQQSVSQVATDEVVSSEAGVQSQDSSATEEQTVENQIPLSRFQPVLDENKDLKAQVSQLQGHLNLVGNQNQQTGQAQQTQPVQESLTLQVMKQMGFSEDGFLTNAEQAQVMDKVSEIRAGQTQQQIQSQQFLSSNPDFNQVVGSIDPASGQFVYAPPLLRVLQANPGLLPALQSAGNGSSALAYALASKDPQYQQERHL